ncbi:MAG: archaeosortase/exosortase family protein [Salinivirgaceae bacterium]|nr:archaeosortase/exosortase family protein [Salinivirgaceae bacterium]
MILQIKDIFQKHNPLKNISKTLKKEIMRFIISFFLAWFFTILLNDIPWVVSKIQSSGIDKLLRNILVSSTEKNLNLLGYETFSHGKYLKIINTSGVRFEYGCLGFRHLSLFVFFILFQFGRTYHKIWYIILGILLLIGFNIIRTTIICVGQFYNEQNTTLVHDIATPVLMYPLILFLWLFWISKYGKPKK